MFQVMQRHLFLGVPGNCENISMEWKNTPLSHWTSPKFKALMFQFYFIFWFALSVYMITAVRRFWKYLRGSKFEFDLTTEASHNIDQSLFRRSVDFSQKGIWLHSRETKNTNQLNKSHKKWDEVLNTLCVLYLVNLFVTVLTYVRCLSATQMYSIFTVGVTSC